MVGKDLVMATLFGSGGGSSGTGGGAKTATGTITVADQTLIGRDVESLRVQHNLGSVPKGVVFLSNAKSAINDTVTFVAEIILENEYMCRYYNYTSSDSRLSKSATPKVYEAFVNNADEITMLIAFSNGYRISTTVDAGTTITWVAWA